GLSDGTVSSLFEDREGNIWVSTHGGLDRFREFAVPTISVLQGLSSRGVSSVLTTKDGSVWLGASDGLNRWNKGQVTIYRAPNPSGKPDSSSGGGLAGARGFHSSSTVREISDSGFPRGE